MILGIAAEKGGVGKTTTAVHLAHYLSLRLGRTLLVDMDSQGQAGMFLGFREERAGMYELLVFFDPLKRGYRPTEELITFGVRENLDLIPNDPRIGEAELAIAGEVGRERILAERLLEVQERYQAIVIDIGPTVNLASLLALYASSGVIIPVAPGPAARAGVDGLMARIEAMDRRLGYSPRPLGVLATLVDGRERMSRTLLPELEARFGRLYLGAIRRSVVLAEAPGLGVTAFEWKPGSRGAEDYARLGERIAALIAAEKAPVRGQGGIYVH